MELSERVKRVVFVTPCLACGEPDALVTIAEEREPSGELVRSWLVEVDCDNEACPSSQAARTPRTT